MLPAGIMPWSVWTESRSTSATQLDRRVPSPWWGIGALVTSVLLTGSGRAILQLCAGRMGYQSVPPQWRTTNETKRFADDAQDVFGSRWCGRRCRAHGPGHATAVVDRGERAGR